MKTTITLFMFRKGFEVMDSFSYEGLEALYDYLTQLEDDCDIEIEFDPVGICCEWDEFKSWEDIKNNYQIDTLEELYDQTQVIEMEDGRLIVQAY